MVTLITESGNAYKLQKVVMHTTERSYVYYRKGLRILQNVVTHITESGNAYKLQKVVMHTTERSNVYFILYSATQCISKLDKIGIFIDMKFH